jgi:UDP-N-acetylglucosamine:LPS N-acetylglucosamine transferase
MKKTVPHVLAVASGGGHWVQICRLIPAWDGCRVTYVTTEPGFKSKVEAIARERGQTKPDYQVVVEANRWQRVKLVRSLLQMIFILLKVRPDVVVTTGAAPGFFALRLASAMGVRTVWIDSIANAEELSLAGRKAGKHCDLWLTQWQHLTAPDGPHYEGAVI